MRNTKTIFSILMLIVCIVSNAQTPPIVYVASDGSGDYTTNGISDQVEINQALDFVASNLDYTTVYLKGSNVFWVNEPIYISSNTTLEGASSAIIKLIDKAKWETMFKALIMQKGATFEIGLEDTVNSVHDITIRGFEIDGNRSNQEEPSGHSYYNMIKLQNCYNITINDMFLHDNLADLLNVQSSYYGHDINLKFFNNRAHGSGHDGIYVGQSINFEIYNNIFTTNRTDAHIRAQDCNHFKIYNNICGNAPNNRNSGGTGVDIQVKENTPLNDVEIYNNYIYGKGAFHGIWLWQTRKGGDLNTHRDVYIHHNIITGNQAAGIGIFGFNNTCIENNVIEFNGEGANKSYTDNVIFGKQSGITFYEGANKNKVKGFTTIVRNNIIGNNLSYGIENKKPNLHTFISDNNCIYNNKKGSYKNLSSNTDIHINPDFACETPTDFDGLVHYGYSILLAGWEEAKESGDFRGDFGAIEARNIYRLKSEQGRWDGTEWVNDEVTSFCINQGTVVADYSNEPLPNGGRINIGAFGNTIEASKSGEIANVNHFTVYPNPTTGIVTVSDEFRNNEYEIFSISGDVVKKGSVCDNEIDLSELAEGIYFIRLKEYKSENRRVVKIVKME